ncbi:MAG TPA: hypothetical protein VFA20_28175 [Myxococcaceae bacterium]|nr:hypothetical protein [Myxococcaceae bacterium]
MSTTIYLLTISLPLATILLVFGMRAFSAYLQAKARFDSDEAYRQVAEKAVSSLSSIQESLADIKGRLASVEKILKAVE